jgi:hypothetical protein
MRKSIFLLFSHRLNLLHRCFTLLQRPRREELNNDKEDEEDNEGEEWENRFSFSSPIVSIFFIVVSLFFKGQEKRN